MELLREEQKRWHPDKFKQRYGRLLDIGECARIMEKVIECAQAANTELEQFKFARQNPRVFHEDASS